jgi:hypothetical protein
MRPRVLRVAVVAAVVVLFVAYIYPVTDIGEYLVLGLGLLTFAIAERAQHQRLRRRLDADQKLKQRYVALTLAPIAVVVTWVAAFEIVLREKGLTPAMDFTRIGIAVVIGVLAVLYFYRARLITMIEKSA